MDKYCYYTCSETTLISTLDSGINVGVRLLIFEKFWSKKKFENDCDA